MRFNAEGLDGLVDRPRPGREPRLSEGEQAALASLILRGPRQEHTGLSSWTLADLCQEVEANWGKRFDPASMSRVVRRLGFSRQKARQVHPQSDAQAQAAFAKKLGWQSWLAVGSCAEVLPGFGEAEEWAGYQRGRS